jgi:hypothetical protein
MKPTQKQIDEIAMVIARVQDPEAKFVIAEDREIAMAVWDVMWPMYEASPRDPSCR